MFVRYPREERKSIADLDRMKIRTPSGNEVPFSEVAVASFGRSYSTIQRADRQRMIRITADVDTAKGANANQVVESLTAGGQGLSYTQQSAELRQLPARSGRRRSPA